MVTVTLGEADRAAVAAAVTAAEGGTDGEIVTIVAASSDRYNDVPLHWALLAMFLKLAIVATLPGWLDWTLDHLSGGWSAVHSEQQRLAVLTVMLVIDFLAVRVLVGWWPLRMALTPGTTKTRRVRRRAVELFRVGAESRTRGKTGVLLYLSLAEHRAELVADAAINAKVAPEAWGEAMAVLIAAVKDGRAGDGMADAVTRIGVVLKAHLPRSADDTNELPDRLIEL